MAADYDIAVIGSGPGGYIAALRAAALGARTAVVEEHYLGGTCLNYGCIPSKALLASAERMHHVAGAAAMGVEVAGEVTLNWATVQRRKDQVVRALRGGVASLLKGRGVKLLRGHGRLAGAGRVAVTAADGTAEKITAEKIVLAPGSAPSRIPGWPEDPAVVCSSDEALHWDALPSRLLIVGGGVIGCEFACMMRAFGVTVTVVEMLPRLLPAMDADLGGELEKVFRARGIGVFTGARVAALAAGDGGLRARLEGGERIEADRVLVAVGRRPRTDDLGLETVGLQTDRGVVRVDERMATGAEGIYCIGDANGRCLLAHAASAQGEVAVANALGKPRRYDAPVPEAVYTFPEIAAVGLTQAAARQRRIPLAVGTFPLAHLGKAMSANDTDGFVKVLRHRETGELVGVHMMGHNVTECIAAAAAMLHQKAAVREVAEAVVAHPTIGEAFREAAEDALGAALHRPPRKRLRVTA
jgi:dihydrolipoamide dehydrogenase